jgi:uncharacterized protein
MKNDLRARIGALDWERIGRSLDATGYARAGKLLSAAECHQLSAQYEDGRRFRSRVLMQPLGFGSGEYKYFRRPLPRAVQGLRTNLYPRLATIANRWERRLGRRRTYPPKLAEFLARCARRGQTKPTPLMLRYRPGDYNCLHQDIYGDVAFPLQFVTVLGRRGADYEGGEFLLVEQRPRAQSKGTAIPLDRGEGLIFATRERPVEGRRGFYRVNMRHGMSEVTSGERIALGVIFHDGG